MNSFLSQTALESMMRRMISKIEIDTAYGPKLILKDPFDPSAKPSRYILALKPSVKVFPHGANTKPIIIAPYGDPGKTKWPMVKSGVVAATAIGLTGLTLLTIKALKKK